MTTATQPNIPVIRRTVDLNNFLNRKVHISGLRRERVYSGALFNAIEKRYKHHFLLRSNDRIIIEETLPGISGKRSHYKWHKNVPEERKEYDKRDRILQEVGLQ